MTAEPAGHDWQRASTGGASNETIGHASAALVKRGVDVLGALVLLLLLAPVIAAAVLAVRLSSPGTVLFRQERVGRNGQPFMLLKLRTMRAGCGDDEHRAYVRDMFSGAVQPVDGLYKLARDPRLTPVGGFLRRTSLDELPQLWNVLRGEMSLVGPRPPLDWEVDLFPAWAMRRFEVRPGLSGLWQVSGRNRLTMAEGLALDVRYVEQQTLLLDLWILARTVRAVLVTRAR
jgi:lipopolysaccharide/colanic/teichoic acid biosynthesis glycosyltransferase